MKPIELIANDLFDKVRSRFTNLQMGDENGGVTVNPTEARFFDFDFVIEGNNIGRVSISINDTGNLKIYYSQGITEGTDSITQSIWYDFLKEMRFFAKRRLMRFDTRDITKGNLDKTDFQYLAANGSKENNMNESAMTGSSKTSHRKLENTDLIIRHSEAIDPTKAGARSRKIKNLYIQNAEGERFKFPFIYLPGARAMQRHVANGGYPHDDAGKHIVKTCEEILKLSDFGRKVRHSSLNDDAHEIIERAGGKLKQLRHHVECMAKQGYYESWAESFAPKDDNLIELDDATMESYKSNFTVNQFDENLSEMFPLLHAIMQEAGEVDLEEYVNEAQEEKCEECGMYESKCACDHTEESIDTVEKDPETGKVKSWSHEGDWEKRDPKKDPVGKVHHMSDVARRKTEKDFAAFESWADDTISESWSDQDIQSLEPLVQEKLPVGANDEAIQALAGVGIQDPALVKALRAVAAMPNGADADARETIRTFMGPEGEKVNWGDLTPAAAAPQEPAPPAGPEAPVEPQQVEPGMEPAVGVAEEDMESVKKYGLSDQTAQAINSGKIDIYDILAGHAKVQPGEQEHLQDMYDNIAGDYGYHGDDDFEDIIDKMHDHIEHDYGVADEGLTGAAIGGTLGALAGGPIGAAAGGYIGHKVQQTYSKEKALKAAQARNNPPSKKVAEEDMEEGATYPGIGTDVVDKEKKLRTADAEKNPLTKKSIPQQVKSFFKSAKEDASYGDVDFHSWMKDAANRVAQGKVKDWAELYSELIDDVGIAPEKAEMIARRLFKHDALQPKRMAPADDMGIPKDDHDGENDDDFLNRLRSQARTGSIKPGEMPGGDDTDEDNIQPTDTDSKDKLIEPEEGAGSMKDVAKMIMGFYDREKGTWTKGEHGVVTHVKRQFSGENGEGGEKEAALAAKLIQHLNQEHESKQAFEDIKFLSGLRIAEAKKPSAGLSKAKKSAVVKKAKAGKDIGKSGKSFDQVAKAAGGGEKGKKIAAAAMWKNIPR